ncbi:hypothetical protein DFH09DRAFT_163045 [Mycena vulgaris]|nr:hypothetical protein DFH09DRAFT_163045 [Mycena vulgaris]
MHETYLIRQLHTCNELSCIAVPGRLLLYMRLILFCFWAGRDPDSCPPTNALQRLIQFVHTGYQWTGTAEAIISRSNISLYPSRCGCPPSSGAPLTFTTLRRASATSHVSFLGLGRMVCGQRNEQRNPYGTAAAFGIVVSPLIFLRVFAPERYLTGNIMCCATFALVVCFHDHT